MMDKIQNEQLNKKKYIFICQFYFQVLDYKLDVRIVLWLVTEHFYRKSQQWSFYPLKDNFGANKLLFRGVMSGKQTHCMKNP